MAEKINILEGSFHPVLPESGEDEAPGEPLASNSKAMCDQCGKHFTTPWNVKRHQKNVHAEEDPVQCTVEGCRQTFRRQELLQAHVKTVHGEREFVCERCEQGFGTAKALVDHGAHCCEFEPYLCRHCPRRFNHRATRARHEDADHKGVTFECPMCGKVYKYKPSLYKHRKTCK